MKLEPFDAIHYESAIHEAGHALAAECAAPGRIEFAMGLGGFVPLPVKLRIRFGEALRFTGESDQNDASIVIPGLNSAAQIVASIRTFYVTDSNGVLVAFIEFA